MPPTSLDPEARRVLVLQGGGALGAYQAGVYESLAAADIQPEWVAGISIGAVNAAIIAGNPPQTRLERLREFWELVSSRPAVPAPPAQFGDRIRSLVSEANAAAITAFGVSGFFSPRFPPAALYPPGSPEALSVYDTAPLRQTLERLVDFDRINAKAIRLSVGAVNIKTGNFTYFDNTQRRIGPEHIMASGALPPGLPPIEIDGQFYWDGGIVSNTPLQYVLDEQGPEPLVIFQVDLFSSRGRMPRTLMEVAEREKDIRFSSRTRLNTDANMRIHELKAALRLLLERLPPDVRDDADIEQIGALAKEGAVTVVQVVYRSKPYEGASRDYEFSRETMTEHWLAGAADIRRALAQRDRIAHAPTTSLVVDPGWAPSDKTPS